jgi:protein-tyrosine phosphatase
MIDIHNHLLDGMDDGPRHREQTLEMCRIAYEDGIRTIVATPHCFDGRFVHDPESIRAAVQGLNEELGTLKIRLNVLPGMEARVAGNLAQNLDDGKLLPLNGGSHVLLEFHPVHVPVGFENLVREFLNRGMRVILAHPEKNLVIQKNPSYLYKLCARFEPWSILTQITADSLTGEGGFWASRTAKILLKHGLAHLVATDAHSPDRRPPRLSSAVRKAAKIVGEEKAAHMVQGIPLAVLEGKEFPDQWEPSDTRRWWRIL